MTMAWLARATAVLGLTFSLSACQTVSLTQRDGSAIEGRLAIQVDATPTLPSKSMTAPFVLQGNAKRGGMTVSTPLGTTLATAQWTELGVWVRSSNSERHYANLDDMAADLLGESLPVAALFDWLRARPWPDVSHRLTPVGFDQLGWEVDTRRAAEGLIAAVRHTPLPRVSVRARVEAPTPTPTVGPR